MTPTCTLKLQSVGGSEEALLLVNPPCQVSEMKWVYVRHWAMHLQRWETHCLPLMAVVVGLVGDP